MSLVLHDFLASGGVGGVGHFAPRNVPRPPVPGEENEQKSSPPSGGRAHIGSASSTRSSGSYRSHISGRSLSSSGKSHSSSGGRSRSSGKSRSSASKSQSSSSGGGDNGPANVDALTPPSAATPRKSNLDRTLTANVSSLDRPDDDDHRHAPLGFEPEGSADGGRPAPAVFVENSPQPACLRWAENIESLLIDRDGVRLFRRFLAEESDSALLDFLFACRGLALVSTADAPTFLNLVRTIYKKYLKGDRLGMPSDIKRRIADRIRRGGVDGSVFDDAVRWVEDRLRNDAYLAFLKSDMYLMYVQIGCGSADSSSGSSDGAAGMAVRESLPTCHGGGTLATVLEEQEMHNVCAGSGTVALELTEASLVATQRLRSAAVLSRGDRYVGATGGASRKSVVNPYHVSYAPVSTRDSELQSLSSDAPTDDTATSHTTTDSSVDGATGGESGACGKQCSWRRQHRSMRRCASANQHTDLDQPFIPRTEMAPRDRNLAENDPTQFATMLIDRLQKVKDDRDRLDHIVQSLGHAESLCDVTRPTKKLPPPQQCTRSATTLPAYSLDYILFPTGVEIDMDLDYFDGAADSILEEHVSRVWDSNISGSGRCVELNNTSVDSSRSSATSLMQSFGGARNVVHPSPDVSSSSFARFSSGISSSAGRRSFCGFGNSGGSAMPVDQRRSDWQDFRCPAGVMHRQVHSTPKSKVAPLPLRSSSSCVASQSDSEMWGRSGGRGVQQGEGFSHHPNRVQRTSSEDSVEFMTRSHFQPCFSSQPNLVEPIENRVVSSGNYRQSMGLSQAGAQPSSCSSLCSGPFHDHSTVSAAGGEGRRSWSSHRSQLENLSANTEPVAAAGHNLGDGWLSSSRAGGGHHSQSFHGRLETPGIGTSSNVLDLSSISNSRRSAIDDDVSCNEPPASTASVAPVTASGPQPPHIQPALSSQGGMTVVGFYLGDEEIPYRTTIASTNVTLGQFKQLVSKRGSYRYFFKKACNEFGSGVVLEEVFDDNEILPLWEGKIIGRVERK